MKKSLKSIEGLGAGHYQKFRKNGISNQEKLLKAAAKRSGRKNLSKQTGITEAKILEFVNRADLHRIKGVGEQYSDLLEKCGVDTVIELSKRNPKNLHDQLFHKNKKRNYVKAVPGEDRLRHWIGTAKRMKKVVNY